MRALTVLLLLTLLGSVRADSFVLVKEGVPQCSLLLSGKPSDDERLAAQELSDHLRLMSGAMIKEGNVAKPLEIRVVPTLEHKFKLEVDSTRIRILGSDGEGCLFGAYELLEQLGVRWYFPGEAGRVCPRLKTVILKSQSTAQSPSFKGRHLQGGLSMDKKLWAVWLRRLRCGGPHFPPSHGLPVPKDILESEPELRALRGGKRVGKQLCVTNPKVLELVVARVRDYFRKHPDHEWMGLGPKDGRGFCQCKPCSALDVVEYDKYSGDKPLSDRYIWFLNQVAEQISEEFPDKKLAFYAYAAIARPPKSIKPHPRLVPAIAPINYCRIHGVDHPLCQESQEVLALWKGWKAVCPEVYHRGYWFNLADPGLMFPMVHRMRKEIPLAKEVGLEGFRVECFHPWASQLPSLYVASRLMWNHQTDVDAVLDDFFQNYYGERSAPQMRQAFELFENALNSSPYHTGSSWDFPLIYPDSLLKKAEKHYQEALKTADPEHRTRIMWTLQATRLTREFNAMLVDRNNHRWASAKAHLDSVNSIIAELTAPEPPLLSRRYAAKYMSRFFAPATEEGFHIHRLHATLYQFPDKWRFRLDPSDQGVTKRWFQEAHPDWPEISSSLSWGTQGLRYFKGVAWYEANFPATDQRSTKKTYLWFAGIDERADIWLNGEPVAKTVGGFKPFEVEVKPRLHVENVLSIRTVNRSLNELGTGGLLGPVVLYRREDSP